MIFWSPLQEHVQEHIPPGGWNPVFSNQDKIKYTGLYFHLIKKEYSVTSAEMITQMIIFKGKYKGLTYSVDQERLLTRALIH